MVWAGRPEEVLKEEKDVAEGSDPGAESDLKVRVRLEQRSPPRCIV